jgi:hypothetical protein
VASGVAFEVALEVALELAVAAIEGVGLSAAIAVEAPMKAPANGMDAIAIAAANAMPLFMSFIVSSLKSFPWPTRQGLTGSVAGA